MDADFTCECGIEPGEVRLLYRVTNHDGQVATVRYCDGCTALAEIDYNGETAKIERLCDECGGDTRMLHDEDGVWKQDEKSILICCECGAQVFGGVIG